MPRLGRHGISAVLLAVVSIGATWALWLTSRPTIVIPWPVEERSEGDRISIDNHPCTILASGPEIQIRVATGTHRVDLRRIGFEPIELQTERLGLGESLTLSPEWKLNNWGFAREKLNAITDEVSSLRSKPVFEQREAAVQLHQLRVELSALEEGQEHNERLGSLKTQLRSPLARPVLARDGSDNENNSERYLLSLGSNKLRHCSSVTAVRFNPSGRLVASGGLDGRVSIHDAGTGTRVFNIDQHEGAIADVRFVNNNQIVSIDRTGLACLTSVSDQNTQELVRANGELTAVAVLDEKRIAIGGTGLRIWIVDTETRGAEVIETTSSVANLLAVTPTDLVAVSPDGLVTVFENQRERLKLQGTTTRFLWYEPDGNLTASNPSVANTWNFKTGRPVAEFMPSPGLIGMAEDRSWLCGVRKQGIERKLVFRNNAADRQYVINISSRIPRVADCHLATGRAAVGTLGGSVLLVDLKNERLLSSPTASSNYRHASFDRTSHLLATATADGAINVLRTFDWNSVFTVAGNGTPPNQLLLAGSTKRVIGVFSDSLAVHSLDEDRVVELPGQSPAALTKDDRYLVYCQPSDDGLKRLCVYDLRRDSMWMQSTATFAITSLLPMPSRAAIVIGTEQGLVTELSWKTGKDRWRRQNKRVRDSKGTPVRKLVATPVKDEILLLRGDQFERWSLQSMASIQSYPAPRRLGTLHAANDRIFATSGNNLQTLKRTIDSMSLPVGSNARMNGLSLTDDGTYFAVCPGDGRLIVGKIEPLPR